MRYLLSARAVEPVAAKTPRSIALKAEPEQQRALIATDVRF